MGNAKDGTIAGGQTALNGPALEEALARGNFDEPKPQLVGIVKASSKSGYISVGLAGCESWVDVPSSLVAEAQQIGRQFCEGHSHPVFRLMLSEPTDPEARALIGLLTAGKPAAFMPVVTAANLGVVGAANNQVGSAGQLRRPQCTSWCVGPDLVCACPVHIPGFGMGTLIYVCGTCINDPVFTTFA